MIHLVLRADSGPAIGSGHVMRCLALAHEAVGRGGTATFLSVQPEAGLAGRLPSAGMDAERVPRAHPAPDDFSTTLKVLDDRRLKGENAWLVLDGYHFDPEYQAAIRRAGHRLLVLDDVADRPAYHADILLNQNVDAERLAYRTDQDTRCLRGPRYTLLRPEFRRARQQERVTPEVATRLLVTMGGSDPPNATRLVLEGLSRVEIDRLEVTTVVGAANPHVRELRRLSDAAPFAGRFVVNADDMAGLMSAADLAIAGAGSTVWELAALGVPGLVLPIADNQVGVAAGALREGIAGRLDRDGPPTPASIAEAVAALCRDAPARAAMTARGRALIDGRGAARVVDELQACSSPEPFDVRPATGADAQVVWEINNDPGVRARSFNAQPIPLARHLEWYERKLASPASRIWIVMSDDEVAGLIRYERVADDLAEIGIALAASHRGRGLGTRALQATLAPACDALSVARVRGIVLDGNPASASAFLKAGFVRLDDIRLEGRACQVFERRREAVA